MFVVDEMSLLKVDNGTLSVVLSVGELVPGCDGIQQRA